MSDAGLTEANVFLAVGLPLAWTASQKDAFANYLARSKGVYFTFCKQEYDKDTMMLVITGGGGCLIKHFYQFDAARVRFIDDICAAAKGYEYMAELQIKAGQA